MNLPDWMLLLQWGDDGWGDEMVRGMFMTLAVAMAAFLLGIVIGTMGAAIKLSRYLAVRLIGEAYTTLIRGVPDLLVIYLLFFGGRLCHRHHCARNHLRSLCD